MKVVNICLVLLLPVLLAAQNLLKPQWKFHTGDDSSWSMPVLDDTDWKEISAGTVWENQGIDSYDGVAWYRQSINIPDKWREPARKNGGLALKLAMIDDADETYWNGELLGRNGSFPPDYRTAYNVPRVYEIPFDKILWEGPNVIAVRVYDGGGGGGIYGQPVELRVNGIADFVVIEPRLIRSDRIFFGDDPVAIPILVKNQYQDALSAVVRIKINSDFHLPILEESQSVNVARGDSQTVSLDLGKLQPGFYEAQVVLESADANLQHRFKFGVNPERIASSPDRPDDFKAFWDKSKDDLAAVAPRFKMIRQDDKCTEERDVFLVEMHSLGDVLIRGWYLRPKKEGKYPAILHVQGYSTNMIPEWCYQGNDMVAFGLNIRGHGNSRDDIDPGFPGYLQYGLNDKEDYIYRGAYMDCLRAVDFLVSQPEVDTTRICVEGGSQGGALSFATAALDSRIDLCVPHVPFLSDFPDYFRLVAWPGGEFANYVAGHPETSWEEVYHILSYVDIKNLAAWIRVPVFMSIGLMDETCPPHTNFAAYNQVRTRKTYKVFPESGHGLPPEYNELKNSWIREQFGLTDNK